MPTTTTGTTTEIVPTSPSECVDGNLDERVCHIEEKNKNLSAELQELRKELQDQINELSNRPCACQ